MFQLISSMLSILELQLLRYNDLMTYSMHKHCTTKQILLESPVQSWTVEETHIDSDYFYYYLNCSSYETNNQMEISKHSPQIFNFFTD